MKKVLYVLLLVILLAVFSYSAWQLYTVIADYQAGTQAYTGLDQYLATGGYEPQENTSDHNPKETEHQEKLEEIQSEEPVLVVDFEGLSQMNPDITGWLYIEGTKISYPVVQAYDNNYYLRRMFDGTRNNAGCLFMDEECNGDFSEYNSIIYGHNMRNGSMFADLVKFKDQEFFEEHPVGYLLTPDKNYKILFFSGYVCGTKDSAWDANMTEEEYAAWLKEITGKSTLATDVVPLVTDQVLTLSTCSYEFSNARYILHGILVDPDQQRN